MRFRRLALLWPLAVLTVAAQGMDAYKQAMAAGERAFAQNDYKKAATYFEKATHLDKRSPEAQLELANALILIARADRLNSAALDQAKSAEQKALELVPNNAEALAGLGEIEYLSGLHPGSLFADSNRVENAVSLLNKALASDARNYHALFVLTRVESAQINKPLIHAAMQVPFTPGQRKQLPPESKQRLREQLADPLRVAMEHANKALAIHPNSFEAMHELAGLYFSRSVIDESSSEQDADLKQQQTWERNSRAAYAKNVQTANLSEEPADSTAPKSYEQAMTQGSQSAATYHYEAALRCFEKAVSFRPQSVEARLKLANMLLRTSEGSNSKYPFDRERLTRAQDEYRRVLSDSPNNSEALAGLGAAALAVDSNSNAPKMSERFNRALDWARQSVAAQPDSFDGNALLAHVASQLCGAADFEAQSAAYRNGNKGGPLPAAVIDPLRNQYGSTLEEGLKSAQIALQRRPGSYLTMSDLSLIYSVRRNWYGKTAKESRQLAAKWNQEARASVSKDDPAGEILRMPAPIPPPAPRPVSSR